MEHSNQMLASHKWAVQSLVYFTVNIDFGWAQPDLKMASLEGVSCKEPVLLSLQAKPL